MLDETGLLGATPKEAPKMEIPPAKPEIEKEEPQSFRPDKMTRTEMIGAGAIMLGNIAFVSWWSMNESNPEVAEIVSAPSTATTPPPVVVPPTLVSNESQSTDMSILEVAEVKQEVSFKEAFDAARAQVGPGGIFEWRGQWYNTYTAEEWQGMTPSVKEDYVELVKPYVEPNGDMPVVDTPQSLIGPEGGDEIAHADTDVPLFGLHSPLQDTSHLDTMDDLFTTS